MVNGKSKDKWSSFQKEKKKISYQNGRKQIFVGRANKIQL